MIKGHDDPSETLACSFCEMIDPTGIYPNKCPKCRDGFVHYAEDVPGGRMRVECDHCSYYRITELRYKRGNP